MSLRFRSARSGKGIYSKARLKLANCHTYAPREEPVASLLFSVARRHRVTERQGTVFCLEGRDFGRRASDRQ